MRINAKKIMMLAAVNAAGFTVSANSLQAVNAGFAVAVADTQNSFGPEGAANVAKYINTHPGVNAVGGWHNSANGLYYFDAVIIVSSEEEARRLGKENKQIAIYNLSTGEEIML